MNVFGIRTRRLGRVHLMMRRLERWKGSLSLRGCHPTRRAQEEAAVTAEEREAGDIWQEGVDQEFAAIEGNTSSGVEGNSTSDEDSDGEGFQI